MDLIIQVGLVQIIIPTSIDPHSVPMNIRGFALEFSVSGGG